MDDLGFYDQQAGSWWDSDGFLHGIGTLLNPVRVPSIHSVLQRFNYQPTEVRFLDMGCGGGLLAEALVRFGYALRALTGNSHR